MPIQIDCPECGGRGRYNQKTPDCKNCSTTEDCYDLLLDECLISTKCDHCKDGKITVYTEAQKQKAIADEREAIMDIVTAWEIIGHIGGGCVEAIRVRGE